MDKSIWEILVPRVYSDGRPIKKRHHKVWDENVRTICGGLTVMPPNVAGEWVSPTGEIFAESMIPVRIYTTEYNMKLIAKHSKDFYGQEAIMYYEISNNVKIYE